MRVKTWISVWATVRAMETRQIANRSGVAGPLQRLAAVYTAVVWGGPRFRRLVISSVVSRPQQSKGERAAHPDLLLVSTGTYASGPCVHARLDEHHTNYVATLEIAARGVPKAPLPTLPQHVCKSRHRRLAGGRSRHAASTSRRRPEASSASPLPAGHSTVSASPPRGPPKPSRNQGGW